MKIIIIGNRKYQSILTWLMDKEERLKKILPEKDEIQTDKIIRETTDIVNSDEVFIDGEKVCTLLCISGRTLLRLCKKHQINNTRVSHRCYYPLSEIEKLFAHRSIAFDVETRGKLIRECKRLKGVTIERDDQIVELTH
jgi:hypothetical protein